MVSWPWAVIWPGSRNDETSGCQVRAQRREEIELRLGTLIKKLRAKFDEEYGSIICNDIETRLFGRSFDKWNPEDRKEKERLGGHDDKCPKVVGKATRWVAQLILEEQSGII